MKIEKLNDYQIRCTLTREDLARRNIKISELAYGTEKARDLFHDMMQTASDRFGFEPDDAPIMVEAIPINAECLVLVITKADDPEELDTRFANFAPAVFMEEDDEEFDETADEGEENIMRMFERLQHDDPSDASGSASYEESKKRVKEKVGMGKRRSLNLNATCRVFSFARLCELTDLSRRIGGRYHGLNTLYKDRQSGRYFLTVHQEGDHRKAFRELCLLLSEYGEEEPASTASEQFLREHNAVVIADHALQKLSEI